MNLDVNLREIMNDGVVRDDVDEISLIRYWIKLTTTWTRKEGNQTEVVTVDPNEVYETFIRPEGDKERDGDKSVRMDGSYPLLGAVVITNHQHKMRCWATNPISMHESHFDTCGRGLLWGIYSFHPFRCEEYPQARNRAAMVLEAIKSHPELRVTEFKHMNHDIYVVTDA